MTDGSAIAAIDGTTGKILISNFNNEEDEYMIIFKGRSSKLKDVKVINDKLSLGSLKIPSYKKYRYKFRIPKHTVVLIEVIQILI